MAIAVRVVFLVALACWAAAAEAPKKRTLVSTPSGYAAAATALAPQEASGRFAYAPASSFPYSLAAYQQQQQPFYSGGPSLAAGLAAYKSFTPSASYNENPATFRPSTAAYSAAPSVAYGYRPAAAYSSLPGYASNLAALYSANNGGGQFAAGGLNPSGVYGPAAFGPYQTGGQFQSGGQFQQYAFPSYPSTFQPQGYQLAASFQPQSFQPQGFQPQSFQPQGFQPQGFQPQASRVGPATFGTHGGGQQATAASTTVNNGGYGFVRAN